MMYNIFIKLNNNFIQRNSNINRRRGDGSMWQEKVVSMNDNRKLKGNKLGVVFGTFAPMHRGHVHLIQSAKTENDGVIVVVSGYEGDRGDVIGLDLQRRFRYAREVFKNDELVKVVKLDETNIKRYPEGWADWLTKVDEELVKSSFEGATFNFYVGEPEYEEQLNSRRPEYQVTLADRSILPISATLIRNDPYKYWNYIAHPFRRHFTKKVLVAGTASTGKTSRVKDLGRLFNAPYSLEYAREYQEKYNITDEELDAKDYMYLLQGQFQQTSDIIDGKENNGLVVADTNSTVTMAYLIYYLKDTITEEEYNLLESLYINTVRREEWDLILFTVPFGEYVDDGFRDMTMAEDSIRDDFMSLMQDLFKKSGFDCPIVYMGDSYSETYQTAVSEVSQLIKAD